MSEGSELQAVANFRDVGHTVNRFLGAKFIREGVVFRSARPDNASPADKTLIRDHLGIRTIIDLRTDTEIIKQARSLPNPELAPPFLLPSRFASRPTPPRINGIAYREIKLTGWQFERNIICQLTWWNFLKVVFLSLLGYRVPAIKVIATQAMVPRGLLGLAIDTIDFSGPEIAKTLSLCVTESSLPILVHCTHGKDRTGLIIILILMILGTPPDAIEHDYFLTDKVLATDRNQILADVREIGLTDEWAATSPIMIRKLREHLDLKYHGLDAYLDGIGVDADLRTRFRELLIY